MKIQKNINHNHNLLSFNHHKNSKSNLCILIYKIIMNIKKYLNKNQVMTSQKKSMKINITETYYNMMNINNYQNNKNKILQKKNLMK